MSNKDSALDQDKGKGESPFQEVIEDNSSTQPSQEKVDATSSVSSTPPQSADSKLTTSTSQGQRNTNAAFQFAAATQVPLYIHEKDKNILDVIHAEARAQAISDEDLQVTKRETHQAIINLIEERFSPEDVVQKVIENRESGIED